MFTDDSIDSAVLSDGTATYQHGLGLLSEVRGGSARFYHADALGTTRDLSDASGAASASLETDAFGNAVSGSGTGTPFGFAGAHGYHTDPDTGWQRLGHRFYLPGLGRFLSRDPIRAGYNWYAYCDNDPVNAVDPLGLYSWGEFGNDLQGVGDMLVGGGLVVWQGLQVLVGAIGGIGGEWKPNPVGDGYVVIGAPGSALLDGSYVTLGPIVWAPPNTDLKNPRVIDAMKHEAVHQEQSVYLGPIYLPAIGAGWVGGGLFGPNDPNKPWGWDAHDNSPLEQDAEDRKNWQKPVLYPYPGRR